MDYLAYLYDFQANDWHLALPIQLGEGAVRVEARIKNEMLPMQG